jgi:hypothetical protein
VGKTLNQLDQKNWFSSNRQPGVINFVLPSSYYLLGHILAMLAQVLHKTPLVREFDCLNAKIKDRFESAPTRVLHVFTPFDNHPLVLCQEVQKKKPMGNHKQM